MKSVRSGQIPVMPRLASMTKKQMTDELQAIWTLMDEEGIQRRNETAHDYQLNIYGRVLAAIRNGPLVKKQGIISAPPCCHPFAAVDVTWGKPFCHKCGKKI